jgi:mannosyl-3-phosphoglycerate phosphatase
VKLRVVFTDLDGTLLEPDGSVCDEAMGAVAMLRERGVPLVPLSSKTRIELIDAMRALRSAYGSYENGAAIVSPAGIELLEGALPLADLRDALARLRESGLEAVSIEEMSDRELVRLTGLAPGRLAAARAREHDLPFVARAATPEELERRLLEVDPRVALTSGGTFRHLRGRHEKSGAAARILEMLPGDGVTAGFGDAKNDDFLAHVDVPVVVPRGGAPDQELLASVPGARVAPRSAGAGWSDVVRALLA